MYIIGLILHFANQYDFLIMFMIEVLSSIDKIFCKHSIFGSEPIFYADSLIYVKILIHDNLFHYI